MLSRDHSHDVLVKNVTAFLTVVMSLQEDKMKRFRLLH